MTQEQILTASISKTKKVELLLNLGLTKKQIVDLLGSAGFIYQVIRNLNSTQIIQPNYYNFTREFGVEIEAFGVDKEILSAKLREAGILVEIQGYNHNTQSCWKIVRDGSVHGTNPFELVSPILKGEEGLNELKKVCDVLETLEAKINKTCGLHIHFNARQFGIKQWRNIYKNYIIFEETINSLMPESRRQNNFCKTLRTYDINDCFNKINEAKTVSQIAKKLNYDSRYYKINHQSFARHGSIEFRQHSGTVEYKKISNWIKILHNLVSYSETEHASNGDLENFKNIQIETELKNYIDERKRKFAIN